MTNLLTKTEMDTSRILIYSQRNIYRKYHYRCYLAEFEDLICKMDSVDLIAPKPKKYFETCIRYSKKLKEAYDITFNPSVPRINLNRKYEIFFAFCQYPKDLLNLQRIEGWKEKCKTSICWLSEMWLSEIPVYKNYLKLLRHFDYVILHWSQSVDRINKIIGNRALFLPLGIDSILFCPYPNLPKRLIDVYSIGRRSEKTHMRLLAMGERKDFLYLYDSIVGDEVMNTNQHRSLFANLAKRSRYFVVNPGKIDVQSETMGQSEIGNRYYEGLAAGTIMIGEQPENEEFKKIFSWPDAVVHVPFGSTRIDEIIYELDRQPDRLHKTRDRNVLESLTRHDWAYRWETMLKMAGLEPKQGFLERKKQLEYLASLVGKNEFAETSGRKG